MIAKRVDNYFNMASYVDKWYTESKKKPILKLRVKIETKRKKKGPSTKARKNSIHQHKLADMNKCIISSHWPALLFSKS